MENRLYVSNKELSTQLLNFDFIKFIKKMPIHEHMYFKIMIVLRKKYNFVNYECIFQKFVQK